MADSNLVEYSAANGHLMVQDRAAYDRGSFWSATHSENCPCETRGADLPDW